MRRAAIFASLLVALAGCGDDLPAPPRGKAPVARVLREWVASVRAEDPDAVCARTFMAYDVARRLWPRIGLKGSATTGPTARTASAARVRRDCLDTYGNGARTLTGKPLIVKIHRIAIEAPVRDGGGITRSATATLTVRFRTPAGPQTAPWRPHLVVYRGRWRVLQGYD